MKRIHIFKIGTHISMGGEELTFSEADLSGVSTSYDATLHEAPLVVGHPKSDGPAYGWVKGVVFEDGDLYVEPHQVDPAFEDLVDAGRYKKISAAFYEPNSPKNPTPGYWHLRHVAFLGAQPPSVKGLKTIEFSEDDGLVTFEFAEMDGWTVTWVLDTVGKMFSGLRDYLIEKDGVDKTEEILPQWRIDEIVSASGEARAAAREDGDASFADQGDAPKSDPSPQPQTKEKESSAMSVQDKKDAEAREAAFAEREGDLSEREKELQDKEHAFAERERRSDAEQFVDGLVSEGKLPPVYQEGLVAFMTSLDEEGTIEFGEGDNAKKETGIDFLKEMLGGLGKTIEFSEVSAAGEDDGAPKGDFLAPAGFAVNPDKAEINDKAVAYQEKHSCDFATAVTAVMR